MVSNSTVGVREGERGNGENGSSHSEGECEENEEFVREGDEEGGVCTCMT
jgi:hypothetical protein